MATETPRQQPRRLFGIKASEFNLNADPAWLVILGALSHRDAIHLIDWNTGTCPALLTQHDTNGPATHWRHNLRQG
ncbi:MAG: hypothetical protein Tsb0016_09140 [Sphingomonadales bacterium]